MPKVLVVDHDHHFDFVPADGVPEENLGVYPVADFNSGEVQDRVKVEIYEPGNRTVIVLPDDFDMSPTSFMHLVDTIADRHAPLDWIRGVTGSDPSLARRVAALLGTSFEE